MNEKWILSIFLTFSRPSSFSRWQRWHKSIAPKKVPRCRRDELCPFTAKLILHVSHDVKRTMEPHLKKLPSLENGWKKTQKSSDWIANIWDFLWHFSTKTNIPSTARARSERSDPAQGWVPKLPGWLPWMWSKPDVCDSWQDSTPKKTMKPKLWSFALYLSTQNVFLSFLVSVFLCSACFFNLSKRLATPPTSDSSGESRENRRAHRNAKSQGSPPWESESRGFFLLEFSFKHGFLLVKQNGWFQSFGNIIMDWGFFSRKQHGLCTKPSWSYSVNFQASLLQLQRSVPLSQTRKLIVL